MVLGRPAVDEEAGGENGGCNVEERGAELRAPNIVVSGFEAAVYAVVEGGAELRAEPEA